MASNLLVLLLMWLPLHAKATCNRPLGMENKYISDFQIVASHWLYFKKFNNGHYAPFLARLNYNKSSGAWCSENVNLYDDQFIQIDLLKNKRVRAIAIQGRSNSVEYVEKFQITYQRDGENQFRKLDDLAADWKVFDGNTRKNKDDVVKRRFPHAIVARKLRVYPRASEFQVHCLRLELYGCKWEHTTSGVLSYRSSYGEERNGVDLRDHSYDGEHYENYLDGGLGAFTDDVYGESEITKGGWVGFRTRHPNVAFTFFEERRVHQVMVYVNNNYYDIKTFKKLDVYASLDGLTYSHVKTYLPNEDQRNRTGAFAIVFKLDVTAKHIRMTFTKGSEWLLVSEIVFGTSPPTQAPVSTFLPQTTKTIKRLFVPTKHLRTTTKATDINDNYGIDSKTSAGMSFPVIVTISLVAFVACIVIVILACKTYKNKRGKSTGEESHASKQNVSLVYEDQILAMQQQQRFLPPATAYVQNGNYIQPVARGSYVPR